MSFLAVLATLSSLLVAQFTFVKSILFGYGIELCDCCGNGRPDSAIDFQPDKAQVIS